MKRLRCLDNVCDDIMEQNANDKPLEIYGNAHSDCASEWRLDERVGQFSHNGFIDDSEREVVSRTTVSLGNPKGKMYSYGKTHSESDSEEIAKELIPSPYEKDIVPVAIFWGMSYRTIDIHVDEEVPEVGVAHFEGYVLQVIAIAAVDEEEVEKALKVKEEERAQKSEERWAQKRAAAEEKARKMIVDVWHDLRYDCGLSLEAARQIIDEICV
jgi:hypothetical protein